MVKIAQTGKTSAVTSELTSPLETTGSDNVPTTSTVVPTSSKIYGYDGTYWDRLRTTSAGDNQTTGILNVGLSGFDGTNQDRLRTTAPLSGGTIDVGLLAVGRVPPADPVEKIKSFTDAATTETVWDPAVGYRWNLTDFVISAKNVADITLYDGTTSTKAIFYFAANGGCVMDLQTPFVATATNTPLTITLTSATVSITTSGYETP